MAAAKQISVVAAEAPVVFDLLLIVLILNTIVYSG